MPITIYYAASDFAQNYDINRLSLKDQLRVKSSLDWRVSRAIKIYSNQDNGIISHSHGHAVYAVSGCLNTFRFGIDLERITQRNFDAWHDTILSDDEKQFLQDRQQQILDYFAIWTLKESLIKASNGEWADLAQVGLMYHNQQWKLHVYGKTDWHGIVWRLDDFMLALVGKNGDLKVDWVGLGSWARCKPQTYCIF